MNVLPSLSSSSQLDKKVKTSLMSDVFSTIGIVPYNRKKFERAQETSYWNRFSGLTKADIGAVSKKKGGTGCQDDGQQTYFGFASGGEKEESKKQAPTGNTYNFNYGNVPSAMPSGREATGESSDEENLAWAQTQHNMA